MAGVKSKRDALMDELLKECRDPKQILVKEALRKQLTNRKGIYTTDAIESLNDSLRKLLKPPGAFPNDEAIVKIIDLAIQQGAKK